MGVSSRNFCHSTCRRAGVIMLVPFLEGPPPKIWEGKKRQKFRFGAISDNFRLWSRLFSERIVTSKVGKYNHQLQLLPVPRSAKKLGELWPKKFSVWATITSGLVAVSSRNFFHSTSAWQGWQCGYHFWRPHKIWEGEKNVTNSDSARFLTTFDFDRDYL